MTRQSPSSRNDLISQLSAIANKLASERLAPFVRMAWPILNPGRPLVWNWHMDAICEHLEAVSAGQIPKLIINVPPGHSKTTIVTECWPCWEWIARPELRYIFASYSDDLSKKASNDRAKLLTSPWYQNAFGIEWRLGRQDWSSRKRSFRTTTQHEINNDRSGEMLATSVGGMGTGRHGDRVVVDDPIKAEDIYTIELENHVRWFNETLRTRRTDVRTTAFVLVMQRLHQAELTGVLLESGEWCHLKLPSLWEEAKRTYTTIGWTDPRKVDGECLFPERFPADYLDRERGPHGLGPIAFAAQHQQDPVAGSGNIFHRDWWRFWDNDNRPAIQDFDVLVGSWDMNFKKGIGTDYVVGQVWGRKGANFYLLDQRRAKIGFVETLGTFRGMVADWPQVTRWLVEDKANGSSIIDVMRTVIPGVIAITPTESKEARAAAVASYVQSGNVFIPKPVDRPWASQLIDEAAAFPNGTYDDQVDALTQALRDMADRADFFTMPEPVLHADRHPAQGDMLNRVDAMLGHPESFAAAQLRAEKRLRNLTKRVLSPGLPSTKWKPFEE